MQHVAQARPFLLPAVPAHVLCVGIATLDLVFAVDAMPQTPTKHRARGLTVTGGGIAANAAVAIARLGGRATLLARLGDDAMGDLIRAGLDAEQVAHDPVPPLAGHASQVSAVFVDASGERMVMSHADPDLPDALDWLPRALPAHVGAVLGDTRWEAAARHLFGLARARGLPAVLDADRAVADMATLAAATHVAFSEQGLAELTGQRDPARGLAMLRRDLGSAAPWLAVTLGARGVCWLEHDEPRFTPAEPVTVVDTLGAGDVWHGAFALALAEGQDETGAVRFASAAAALKCQRPGGRAGAPTRAELQDFLARRAQETFT